MLQALHRTFQTEKRVVLAGREGTGKSTLAREYIRQFGTEYRAIAWLDAATDETFLANLCEALQEFALPVDVAQGTTGLFQELHAYLSERQQALLVLDHLQPALKTLDSSEQPLPSYDFLVITQQEKTPAELPRLELTGLEAQDGARLVLRQADLLAEQESLAGDEVQTAALELAREMQGSPLALRLAGGYLRHSGGGLPDYLELFRSYPVHLQLQDDEELAVAGEICLAWIEQKHPAAREILRTCALLARDAIPGVLLREDDEETMAQAQETIQLLRSIGLLDVSEDGVLLRMHPLLQQLTRQFYGLDKQPQQQQQSERLLSRLRCLLPTLAGETLSTRLRVAGHIRYLEQTSREWETTAVEGADVFSWAAMQLWEQQMPIQAEALLRRSLAIWEQATDTAPLVIATALEKLAALNAQIGNHAEATELALRALTSKTEARGINHPEVLLALQQVGQYYMAQQKENEAEACYRKVIQMAETLNLRLHPVYSEAKYHLALLCIEQKRWKQAEDLLRRVCIVWNNTLGERHRSTREAWLKLAEVATRLEHWEKAHNAYQRVLPAYAEDAGREDPLVMEHLERAALVMGKLEEAKRAMVGFERE